MPSIGRWSEIVSLFEQAVDRDTSARESFLREACDGDSQLRAAVETLLRADENADGFLDEDLETAIPVNSPLIDEPARLGQYRVIRRLGRGGMGIVYLAERAEDYHRKVAIKVMARNVTLPVELARFRREREILSKLEHPFIARLYGAGVDEEHGLYFVMEYVDGLPITTYCQRQNLSLEERLKVFGSVCEAVAFAHRHLVIHRDLKPQNILVNTDGVVKLLDFGIVKLLGEGADALPTVGSRPMTPAYASPEQLLGEPVDTLSDVYSLGVVLYELLTEQRPFTLASHGPRRIPTVAGSDIPRLPSEAVLESDVPALELSKRLRGDLDRIVLKALEPTSEDRYASARALLDDINLFLAGRPISVKPLDIGYAARKFIRRNRLAVLSSSVLTLCLLVALGLLVDSSIGLKKEKAIASGLTSYLTELFEVADPSHRSDTTISYEEILRVGLEQANENLRGKGDPFFTVTGQLGRLYTLIGKPSVANSIHSRALKELSPGSTEARVTHLLGYGESLFESGHYGEAIDALTLAIEIQQQDTWVHPRSATILIAMTHVERERGRLEVADSLAAMALDLRREISTTSPTKLAEALVNLGVVKRQLGALAAAERLYLRANDILVRSGNGASLEMAQLFNGRGVLALEQQRYEAASSYFDQSLEIYGRLLGRRHPRLSIVMINKAMAAFKLGNPSGAASLEKSALENLVESKGAHHPDVSFALNSMGVSLGESGDLLAAESLYVRALNVGSSELLPDHPLRTLTWNNLAVNLRMQRKYEQAQDAYLIAISGYDHPAYEHTVWKARALNGLGKCQLALGQLDGAIDSF